MKRNHYKALNLLTCALLLLFSCVEENTFDTKQYVLSFTPTVSTNVSTLDFAGDGGRLSFTVTCNTLWTASTSETWFTLNPSNGTGKATLTVDVAQNPDASSRTGTIAVSCGGTTKTVTVTQIGLERFSVSPESFEFSSEGGVNSLTVTSNTSWTASGDAEWFSFSSSSGTHSGTGDATISVAVQTNTTTNSREGKISFKAGDKSYEVVIKQEGAVATFSVTPDSLSFTSDGGSKALTVSSNQSWTVSSGMSWLTLSETSGTGDAALTLTATANTSTERREGRVTFKAGENSYEVAVTQEAGYYEEIDGHYYVDLGLPSGLLWATMNVGASSPEDYGDYFAWGETTTKGYYDWSTYKWGSSSSLTKYNTKSRYGTVDNKTVLELSDDAASVNWGGSWRMPTKDEWTELKNSDNCTWTWTTQGGHNGYKVTSKSNGNSIFLPAAGCRDSKLSYAGDYGYYWSSSLYAGLPYRAWGVNFRSGLADDWYDGDRYYGVSVRPVCRP